MEPIRSGTTTERIIRTTILTGVLIFYSLWSFWDAYRGYPHKNLEGLVQNLATVPAEQDYPRIDNRVTQAAFEELVAKLDSGHRVTASELTELLGEPAVREGDTAFFFGPAGLVKVVIRNDAARLIMEKNAPVSPLWIGGVKTEGDIFYNQAVGVIVGVIGVLMLLQWIRVLRTRVELTDAGLEVSSQGGFRFGATPRVPLEAITRLGTEDLSRKGWVHLHYRLEDGREGVVSLNDYVHKAFRPIITAICEQRGFENPLTSEEDEEHDEEPLAGDEAEADPPADAVAPGDETGQAGG